MTADGATSRCDRLHDAMRGLPSDARTQVMAHALGGLAHDVDDETWDSVIAAAVAFVQRWCITSPRPDSLPGNTKGDR